MVFQYQPLDPNRSEIRLLTLQPGGDNDDVQGSLSVVSLDDAPKFEALSYVWGDPNVTLPIIVDNEYVQVTVNLHACLLRLGRVSRPRVIWADAVCINQQDVHEKNGQIPLMSRIYSDASSVVAWLGESDNENIKLALTWAETYLGDETRTEASRYWRSMDSPAISSPTIKQERCGAILRSFRGFLDLFSLPYWGRMWTFQELCLAVNELVIIYGGGICDSSIVLGDWEFLFNEVPASLQNANPDLIDGAGEWLDLVSAPVLHKHIAIRGSRESTTEGGQPGLFSLLLDTTGCQSTDPRDRVYALYGLNPELQKSIPADYGKSFNEVLQQATEFIMNNEQGMHIYRGFDLRESRLRDTSSPSWIPNFSISIDESPHQHYPLNIVAPSLQQWDQPSHSFNEFGKSSTLHVWARKLEVCKIVLRFNMTVPAVLEQLESLLQPAGELSSSHDLWKLARHPEGLIGRIARATVSHDSPGSKLSTAQILEGYANLRRNLDRLSASPSEETLLAITETLLGKTVFVLPNGCFGIGGCDMQDRDIVTLPLQGAPLVLRKEGITGIETSPEFYRMVGNVYVDGVMEGECLDIDLIATLEKQKPVKFSIH